MTYDYLKQLPLTSAEREQLKLLAAETPQALLSLMQTAPEAFRNYLGDDRTQALTRGLEQLLGPHEVAALQQHPPLMFATGALLPPVPPLSPPAYDLAERDRLFDELQRLRQGGAPSREVQQKIVDLEHRLNSLLAAGQ